MKNLLTLEHKNIYGEVMTLVLTNNYEQLFKHEDCNDVFEKLSDLQVITDLTPSLQKALKIKKKNIQHFKYVLDNEEWAVLNAFNKLAMTIIEAEKKFNKSVENTPI